MTQLPDPNGLFASLLRAAQIAQQAATGRAVLIGGVAVLVRAGSAYRVTEDADHVVDAQTPTVAEVLLERDDTTRPTVATAGGGVLVQGALIELIELGELSEEDVAGLDDLHDRAFVSAHRWALDTGERTTIELIDGPRFTLDVATPAALVACKVSAMVSRRGRPEKAATDFADLIELSRSLFVPTIDEQLQRAPYGLAQQLRGVVDQWTASDKVYDTLRAARSIGLSADLAQINEIIGRLLSGSR